jgi:hypothetical protein
MKSKANNIANVLHPYRTKYGIWQFDDEELGIVGEPFVGAINTMIDMYANGREQITVYISSSPIYEQTLSLTRVEGEQTGIYQLDGTEIVGWLCPCLLNFFPDYIKHIYAKIN